MKQFLVLSAFVVAVSLQFVYCSSLEITNTGPSFEIRDGNCTNATLADLVFQDHVHRYGIPFMTRDDKSHWAGDKTIYCIMALSQDSSGDSTVEVTEGGTNHTFVTVYYKSAKSHGYEYNLQVFGK